MTVGSVPGSAPGSPHLGNVVKHTGELECRAARDGGQAWPSLFY